MKMRKQDAAVPEISQNHRDKQGRPLPRIYSNQQESMDERIDIHNILKDIQYLGSSTMTWKERKKLENEKVVALGGKAPKKHLVPLNVGKAQMKNQRKRERKIIEEDQILGRFTKRKRRAEDRVLKASEGHFSKGVLNVRHLLQPNLLTSDRGLEKMNGKGKRKRKGKGKGKGKKRRN